MFDYIPIHPSLENEINDILKNNDSKIETFAIEPRACDGNCSGSCAGSCSGSCSGTCSDTCTNTCTGSCTGSCSGLCTGKCQTNCESSCSPGCQTRCENGGQTVYSNNNTSTFSWQSNPGPGKPISITAQEWNEFASIAESNAPYCGKSLNIARAIRGEPITASIFNNLNREISKLKDTGVSTKYADESIIKSQDFWDIQGAMNFAPISNVSCCELGQSCVQHCNQSAG